MTNDIIKSNGRIKIEIKPGVLYALLGFLALLLLFGCSAAQKAQESQPTALEATAVNEKAGPVFDVEKRLYADLDDMGILVPDSVVVVEDTLAHGWVSHLEAPRTVHLTTRRADYPDAKIPDKFPYLFDRNTDTAPDSSIFRAYVAAHELAHIQGPRLKAEMGRPALGVDRRTQEVQADIVALVLLHQASGLTYKDLGYPARIDYPHVPDKTVRSLQRKYCVIIRETWDVQNMDCRPQSQVD